MQNKSKTNKNSFSQVYTCAFFLFRFPFTLHSMAKHYLLSAQYGARS